MIWTYNGKAIHEVNQMPDGTIGFVYKIMNLQTGKFYIGRKVIVSKRKTRISKREKEKTNTRKIFKIVVKESNWKTYTGSCKELNEDIQEFGEKAFHKFILEYCCSKKYMNYTEISYQIKADVLKIDSYNGNILGKYYRKDMEGCK